MTVQNLKAVALTSAIALALSSGAANSADIVDTAVDAGQFTTLAAALGAAGLVDTLKGEGPFTVYAPTDAAFAALPEGTVETLMKPENKDQLTNVLLYHVDDRKLTADMIPHGSTFFKPILASERICINNSAGSVTIADGSGEVATVVVANITADNGVIHVVDKVLLPGTRPSC
ncbi:fasciclin domain-containing protein [Parasedimentitalea maritima]|uniref:Fasciclin domain-containing protein n=1 Tax=Parasedimentitalea maritima TaxID=2578117 RepID=A0A6A4RCJ6_9RHOB|nr:fasciclin domain-containing protein [Zongyanglinia marina]KAE9631140.1 fasciclin domain-containing protein [Zongyanglinia marina]